MNFFKILKFDFINILKNPMLVIMNTIFPLVLFGGFGVVTKSKFGGSLISSYDFYGVATIIICGVMVAMTVTNTFMAENVKSGNIRVMYAPVSKAEIYLSKLISSYIFAVLFYSLSAIIEQYVFGSNFGGKNIVYIIILVAALTFFGCSIGTLACCILKSEEKANAITPLLAVLFIFFGGIFAPLGHFGKVMKAATCLSPVKWVTECSFMIIYNNDFSLFKLTIAILLIASIVCIGLCQITFKLEDYV